MSVELTQGKTVTRLPAKAEIAIVFVAFVVTLASLGFWFADVIVGWQSLWTVFLSLLIIILPVSVVLAGIAYALFELLAPIRIRPYSEATALLVASLVFAWLSASNFFTCRLTGDLLIQFRQIEAENSVNGVPIFGAQYSGQLDELVKERDRRLDQAGYRSFIVEWRSHAPKYTITLWLPWR